VADELIIVDQGLAKPFDGDLEDYARWFMLREQQEEAQVTAANAPLTADQKKLKKREEAERRNKLTPLKTQIAQLEKDIAKLESERSTIESALSAEDIYLESSKTRLLDLLDKQGKINRSLETAETAWLEATEKLEQESKLA
jgi:ATP-binding cassette subfamily F protein 3